MDSIIKSYEQALTALKEKHAENIEAIESSYRKEASQLNEDVSSKLASIQKQIAGENLDEALRIRDKRNELLATTGEPTKNNEGSDKLTDLRQRLKESKLKTKTAESELLKLQGLRFAFYGVTQGRSKKLQILYADGTSVFFSGNSIESTGKWESKNEQLRYTWELSNGRSGVEKAKILSGGMGYVVLENGTSAELIYGDPSIVAGK